MMRSNSKLPYSVTGEKASRVKRLRREFCGVPEGIWRFCGTERAMGLGCVSVMVDEVLDISARKRVGVSSVGMGVSQGGSRCGEEGENSGRRVEWLSFGSVQSIQAVHSEVLVDGAYNQPFVLARLMSEACTRGWCWWWSSGLLLAA